MQILGNEGVELLCKQSNARAMRKLSKSPSSVWNKRWKDLIPGTRFCIFLGVFLGTAILGIGSKHLMKKKPDWISQLGPKKLFEKLPTDLFRL